MHHFPLWIFTESIVLRHLLSWKKFFQYLEGWHKTSKKEVDSMVGKVLESDYWVHSIARWVTSSVTFGGYFIFWATVASSEMSILFLSTLPIGCLSIKWANKYKRLSMALPHSKYFIHIHFIAVIISAATLPLLFFNRHLLDSLYLEFCLQCSRKPMLKLQRAVQASRFYLTSQIMKKQ